MIALLRCLGACLHRVIGIADPLKAKYFGGERQPQFGTKLGPFREKLPQEMRELLPLHCTQ